MASEHFATLERLQGPFEIRVGQTLIAAADHVLLLRERYGDRDLPPVPYFPPESLDSAHFRASTHRTHCPIKGDAAYHDLRSDAQVIKNIAWYYPDPVADLAPLAGYVAFYPQHVNISPAPTP